MEDLSGIRAIAHEVWPIAYSDVISSKQIDYMLNLMYSDEALLHQMQEENCEFILLSVNDEWAGFASYSEVEKQTYKLHKLYVLTKMQGTGLGKMLLDEVEKRARTKGGRTLLLQVNKNNKAKYFYERNGFVVDHELVVDIGNGFVMDDYVMKKLI